MKSINLLAFFCAIVITTMSCASTQNVTEDEFDESTTRRVGNRVYVDDPFYGTVILERDPFSGRYYDVTYGYRGYASPYNRYYKSYRSTPRYYRGNGSGSTVVKPSQKNMQETREEARKKILGN